MLHQPFLRTAPPRNWPVGSDSLMMPILLPVLVRRSCRETTVAATGPPSPRRARQRENSAQDCTRIRFSAPCVIVERMAGQEEADGLVFALAAGPPAATARHSEARNASRIGTPAEHARSAPVAASSAALARRQDRIAPANTRARFFSSASNAPAAASDSSTRLLIARGLMREAKVGEIA
jgi:hypothetical protein